MEIIYMKELQNFSGMGSFTGWHFNVSLYTFQECHHRSINNLCYPGASIFWKNFISLTSQDFPAQIGGGKQESRCRGRQLGAGLTPYEQEETRE